MKLFPVVEAFRSIQGEGPFSGYPAFFLRVKECNYEGKCPVGCDTYPRIKNMEETFIPYDTVLVKARKTNRVVITGGEPTLYRAKVTDLITYLDQNGWRGLAIEVETNGYLLPSLLSYLPCLNVVELYVNWSPKEYDYEKFQDTWRKCDWSKVTNYCIKVVVWDSVKVRFFVGDLVKNGFGPKLWLMPRGRTKEEMDENWPVTVELAMEYNVKVTGRLQIETGIL